MVKPGHQVAEIERVIDGNGRFLVVAKAGRAGDIPQADDSRHEARVLVADDSDVFLGTAASVISATSTLRLVGAVGSGEEAIRLLPQLRPDLVLLDFRMPGMDGVQTTRIIHRDEPRTVVIVISAEPEGLSDVAEAAGAAATLQKRDFVPSTLEALWRKSMPDG